MFVEETEFSYVRCDNPLYVPPKTVGISGSKGTTMLNITPQVWGVALHDVKGDFVDGLRLVPPMVADRLLGLEANIKELEAQIKISRAEERRVLELAYEHGDLVSMEEVQKLAINRAQKAVAS